MSAHSDRTALRHGADTVSHAQLRRRAAECAALVRAALGGDAAERVVGVMLPRGPELVIALLGVLRSGAAVLPIDPELPPERVARLLEIADVCVCDGAGRALVAAGGVVAVELPGAHPGAAPDGAADPVFPPEQAACVLFTSGTTGTPKGVTVSHGALANLVAATTAAYGLRADDRVLQFATAGFDVVFEEILPTLAAGAELVLLPSAAPSAAELAGVLEQAQVTVANLPTPYWEHWVRELSAGAAPVPESLRLLVVGSSAGSRATLAAWRAHSDAEVVNAYGLTETTVTATLWRAGADQGGDGALPVGGPLAGVGVRVLDARLAPVPAGEVGEVYLAGAGLARGYHGAPGATAMRFTADPQAQAPGARMYRTGDLGRQDADGTLHLLGRADELVKIRGQRIHPQEVTGELTAHPQVAAAHTAVHTDLDGVAELLAYVVAADPHAVPTAGQLRAHLAERLPAGHVPTRYIVVDELPLKPNGKVDTAVLPVPLAWQRDARTPLREPAEGTEADLAAIWREVLRLDRLGADDSFFDVGGHSLAIARIANRIVRRWGVRLSVGELVAAPTVADQAALLARAAGGESAACALPPFRRAPEGVDLPLSAQQQQVWFLDRLVPGSVAYHAQTTFRVIGDFDLAALQQAVDTITARHAIFRTTYHDPDGTPVQRIHPTATTPVELIDLSGRPEGEQRSLVEQLALERMREPFDLGSLPLMRWTVLRLAPGLHELVLIEHHLVHDGWSFGVLMRELRAAYTAAVTGLPSTAPEVLHSYADYAAWQRAALDSPALRAQREHWERLLADAPEPAVLPTSAPRTPAQTFRGGTVRIEVPVRTATALRRLARQERATLYSTMLAGFFALLARTTGQQDLLIGSGFANRQLAEVEQMIGMLVNPVLLRCDATGDPAFTELVRRARDSVLSASANQEYPFLELVRRLNPDRDPTANPYFQLMFSSNDADLPDLELPGCSATVYERDNGSAKVDLSVIMIPRAEAEAGADGRVDGRITMLWEYNADLFEAEFIAELAAGYLRLLGQAAAAPGLRLTELDPFGPARRLELAAAGQAAPAQPAVPLAALIEQAARKDPQAVAVRSAHGQLEYGELLARAAAVAARLDAAEVPSDEPVGVFARRTPQLLAALLGIVLSGRAYLPLDPAYPQERTAYTLADSGVRLVLTDEQTAHLLPEGPWRTEPLEAGAIADGAFPRCPAHPEATAYVTYTSGSTGRPKACRITHGNLDHVVRWVLADTPPEALARVAAATSVCFDFSVHEIFPTLAAGGTVELLDSALDLPGLLATGRPTMLSGVPSILADVLRDQPLPPSLRLVNLGGEVVPPALVARLYAQGAPEVRSVYGPTETTVITLSGPAAKTARTPGRPIPLGAPIPGSQVYVVDGQLRPLPPGWPGELLIGGDGVAAGYRGRPGLTAERFCPDPFSGRPGARLYRTGDRARWTADGQLEFLGRQDDQVKIRGVRIEPGEIEQVLAAHETVAAAYVVVTGEAPDLALVAYVRPAGPGAADPAELRRHAGAALPAALVPSAFVLLTDVPLTQSGKLDRARLPLPVAPDPDPEPAGAEEPTDEFERGLWQIWSEELGAPELGRHENFFLLGGHSLLMLRVRHRVLAELGRELSIPEFFDHPTTAEMAAHLREQPQVSR
ncbi:amino acid adenylation domain-containing protein [Kitasatospora sp. NPDC002227]|uniref:amino acid adenylation domain-containing protein n=1 Tax=Kitasatospora sp. NPDC002227 TaxID=3154773 RepID=UPI00332B1461